MANALGISMPEIYGAAESIAGQQQNRLMQKAQYDSQVAEQNKAEETENKLRPLREKAAMGDRGAMAKLTAFRPDEAAKIYQTVSAMDKDDAVKRKEEVETIGRVGAFLATSKNPQDDFKRIYSKLPKPMQETLGKEYDPAKVELMVAQARQLDDVMNELHDFAKMDKKFEQDKELLGMNARYDKELLGMKARYDKELENVKQDNRISLTGTGDSDALKASMTEARKLVASLFDAKLDANGEFVIFTKAEDRAAALSILTEAERLMQGGMGHAKAVQEATNTAKQEGIYSGTIPVMGNKPKTAEDYLQIQRARQAGK